MDYLLKSTICLTAFYGLYFFGFRRMSFHALNRFYLLVSLALSLTIPLLSYERTEIVVLEPQPIQEATFAVEETQENTDNQVSAIQQPATIEESPNVEIDWMQVLNTIYLVGVGVMFFLFLKNILTIIFNIKKTSCGTPLASVASSETSPASLSHRSRSKQKLKILLTKSQSNSSFFNYIFLNPENLNPHEEALIIAHEGFHAQRLHTLDLLLLGILKAVFWFNPIVYFYQKSLKQIHEYEVDALMSATYDGREYAHLLLKLGVSPSAMITSQFSTKPLSERIQFLFKTPTQNMKKLLYFLSLPIITVGVMAFAEEKVVKVYREKEEKKIVKATSASNFKKVELKTNYLKKVFLDTLKKEKMAQIDSTKFTYYLSLRPKKGNIDSFKVIVNNHSLVEGRDFIVKGQGIYLDQRYKGTRPSFHVYSTAMEPVLYPYLTKLDEISLEKINLSSKLTSFFASNYNRPLSKPIKISFPDARPIKSQDTLRTILETNKLGKNPIVIINDIEYPSSILYRINPEAVLSMQVSITHNKRWLKIYDEKTKDGIVRISTKKNVEFLLKNEKEYQIALENIKNLMLPSKGRVKRVLLKDFNGRITEKVSIIDTKTGYDKVSMKTDVGKKAIFFIDNVLVSEDEVNNYKDDLFYNGYKNKIIEEKYPDEVKSADVIFNLKSQRN